jgi:transcriptional regulator with XRE-family HTH domain
VSNKSPDKNDQYIGKQVRVARLMKGLSQTELGEHLGVTFQQVQKYEKGTNRIGAGRLISIARALAQPMSYFYGEATEKKGIPTGPRLIQDMLTVTGGLALAEAFLAIANPAVRRTIVAQVKAVAAGMGEQEARPRRKAA